MKRVKISKKLELILYFWILKILGFNPFYLLPIFKRHCTYAEFFDNSSI